MCCKKKKSSITFLLVKIEQPYFKNLKFEMFQILKLFKHQQSAYSEKFHTWPHEIRVRAKMQAHWKYCIKLPSGYVYKNINEFHV